MQHVIYLQFDNVHFTRDNPNVPSDLEQMPSLLSFLEQSGVLLTDHHTPLIAYTADDILTSLTGLYGDRHGMPVSNSYGYARPDGSTAFTSSFAYWTDTVPPANTTYNLLTAAGTNTPAPWAPFTRAGCNVGAAGIANMELENAKGDVTAVFGAGSPQSAEASADQARASADFVGVAVHCAQGDALCDPANGGVPDLLPSEPGGYDGFNALFGHASVAPQISPDGPLTALDGRPLQDAKGNAGFPGFDGMSPAVSLAYVAAMQERGIPVTYAYLSDAHDDHATGNAFGPGEAGYVAQLQAYDAAFAAFFARLAADGITPGNTLFVITADEGDHFDGVQAGGCDGVATPCTYNRGITPEIGEFSANLSGLLAQQAGGSPPFDLLSDSAPTLFVRGAGQADPTTRALERAAGQVRLPDPYNGGDGPLATVLADQAEMRLLHMVTADPARTPALINFGRPDLFLHSGPSSCVAPCGAVDSRAAWSHGTIDPAINTTWLGLVGPGVRQAGMVGSVWSDHTDIRPTLMALVGLQDDYVHDGRVLVEVLQPGVVDAGPLGDYDGYGAMAQLYKQINAPLGELARGSWPLSTAALASDTPGDACYAAFDDFVTRLAHDRDAVAAGMRAFLDQPASNAVPVAKAGADDVAGLTAAASELLSRVRAAVACPAGAASG